LERTVVEEDRRTEWAFKTFDKNVRNTIK